MDTKLLFRKKEEYIIQQSSDNTVVLTNYRLRYKAQRAGKAHVVSILLEKISSIEIHYKSKFWLLVIGVFLMLTGFLLGAANQGDAMVADMVVGSLCLLIYYFTRKHVVSFASDGGVAINFETKGMTTEALLDFINAVELAKLERDTKSIRSTF